VTIGPLYGAAQLVESITHQLRTWLPSVLAEVNAAHELALPEPDAYERVLTADAVRVLDRTTVTVSVPGVTSPPTSRGDGTYEATFGVVVATYVRADDYAATLAAAAGYAVAVRTALLQHPPAEVADLAWAAEDVIPVGGDASSSRTLALAVVELDALVPGVVDAYAGPHTPPTGLAEPGVAVARTSVPVPPT
jgi:hypothetical protein